MILAPCRRSDQIGGIETHSLAGCKHPNEKPWWPPLTNSPTELSCLTERAVALHPSVCGAAKHRAYHLATYYHHPDILSVGLLHVLLEQVGHIVADHMADV